MTSNIAKRFVIIPAVLFALPMAVLLTPAAVLLFCVADMISRLWRLPLARLWLFFVAVLAIEWYAIAARLGIMVGRTLRLYKRRPRVMATWAGMLLATARGLLRVQLTLPDPVSMPPGRLLLLSRHSSMVDAILPAWLINGPMNRPAHYVLKQELSWLPSINLFVPVLGSYFVHRGAATNAELEEIAALATEALPESVLVIFPEGTYATPANRHKVRASLEKRGEPEAVALAERLQNLLPPKPGGTLTLLENRPDADVIIFAHSGLEFLGDYSGIRRSVPLTHPVRVQWWHVPRSAIPDDVAGQQKWLQSEWERMDGWVAAGSANHQQT